MEYISRAMAFFDIELKVQRMDGCYCRYEEGDVFVSHIAILV